MPIQQLVVPQEAHDTRVDIYVTRALGELAPSRMFVKRLIDAGKVCANGKPVKAHYKVCAGDAVRVDISPDDYPDDRIKPEAVALDIVYEDEEIIALNKPAGMAVHPASGNYGGTLANALVHHVNALSDVNGARRPGIVHRLDRETSGIILVARTNMAHVRLAKQFEERTIEKKYVALVEGEVQFDEGVIDAAIGRHPKYHDLRRVVPKGAAGAPAAEGADAAKHAVTCYTVIRRSPRVTAVALFPETGRTHQLRLHMRHLGHPVLGDEDYGNKGSFSRLALHAQAIFFKHPRTGLPLELSVPLPAEFLPYV